MTVDCQQIGCSLASSIRHVACGRKKSSRKVHRCASSASRAPRCRSARRPASHARSVSRAARQHVFQRLFGQMVEQDFGHRGSRSLLVMVRDQPVEQPHAEAGTPGLVDLGSAASPSPVPAMSRCAHGVSLTKRCRNCAAVIDAAIAAADVLHVGESCESISLSYSAPSGMRQTRSPVALPAWSAARPARHRWRTGRHARCRAPP